MAKLKTSELIGSALDYAVGLAEDGAASRILWRLIRAGNWKPSTDWAQGGPIIGRKGIFLWRPYGVCGAWSAKLDDWPNERVVHADTPLIAAMRCYVASKLGDEVDVPDELIPVNPKEN